MKVFILIFLLKASINFVKCFDRFFIPTQEHFFAQQSSASVFHHRQQHSQSVSAEASASSGEGFPQSGWGQPPIFLPPPVLNPGIGFGFGSGWYHPFFSGLVAKPSDFVAPTILKPSVTGWETNYNVPCGSYQIYPFVVANLRLGSAPSPIYGYPSGKRFKKSIHEQSQPEARSYLPYFPSKSCSWDFSAAGCKLKFKCEWFQLPALFRCEENALEISDAESEKHTFCGSRQPRRNRIYNSTTGKMKLTFRSQQPSLPAVFDCTVSCGVEYLYSVPPGEWSTSSASSNLSTKVTVGGSVGTSAGGTTAGQMSSTPAIQSTVANSTEGNNNSTTSKPPITLRFGQCKCGVQDGDFGSRGRIVGGIKTSPGEYPWTAALVRKNSQRPFCSGSLISSLYVATAAHCVLSNAIRQGRDSSRILTKDLFDVLLNEHNINDATEIPGGPIRIRVSRIIVHPHYDNATYNYDIALLRLEKPIQFQQSSKVKVNRLPRQVNFSEWHFPGYQRRGMLPEVEVRARVPSPVPICLSSRSGKSLVDKSGVVTGWGLTKEGGIPSEEMLQATVKIFNETSCRNFYREHHYVVTENMICAGHLDGQTDSCVGDSGGGLSIKENERYTLAGIVSWGRGCGRQKLPGVYTRIAGLTDWIQLETQDALWCS